MQLYDYVAVLGMTLQNRFAYAEALPYARRALELAPARFVPEAAQEFVITFLELERCAEAKKV